MLLHMLHPRPTTLPRQPPTPSPPCPLPRCPAADVLNSIDITSRLNQGWFSPSTDMSWSGSSKEGYGWYARVALDVPGPGPALLEYSDQEAPAEVVALFSGDGARAIAIGERAGCAQCCSRPRPCWQSMRQAAGSMHH